MVRGPLGKKSVDNGCAPVNEVLKVEATIKCGKG